MPEPTIGIDLGTTNSVVAATDEGGEPRVLPDQHDEKIHPSVVSFHPNGTVIVGAVAKQRRVIDPKNTVFSIKRLIGRPFNSPEVKAALERMPFRITEGPNEQPIIHTRGGQFAIPEISAIVLDHMAAIAKRARRTETTKAVITVPANFNEGQRSATATAGAIAGLEVIRILNEPTAAAIAYGHRRRLNQLIAVYDFGGGTFDVSILSVKDQLFEVVATAGNTFLGGDDIDETLVDHMIELFLRQEKVDLRPDDLAMQRLRSVAEQIKIQLSRRSRAIVKIDEIAYGPGGRGLDLNLEITREELVARCAHVVDQTFPVCDEALTLAGVDRDAITDVVLVGGTTKMPYVRQRATQYFGKQPRVDVNPDEAVALGAALQANVIAMEIAGEMSYRRVGTSDTKSEVTRIDEEVGQRVASMLRQSQERRSQGPSKSIIVEEGDTDLEFADDFTDGSGIFVSVEPDDFEATRAGSEITQAEQLSEPDSEITLAEEQPDKNDLLTATDKGWDASAAWSADSAWETYPSTEEDGETIPQQTAPKVDTLQQFPGQRTTDKGVAMAAPLKLDDDDEMTVTRAKDKALGKPMSTKPLPAMEHSPATPTPSFDVRATNKMPPPAPKRNLDLPPPLAPAEPRAVPPVEPAPLELMPEPLAAPPSLSPGAKTMFEQAASAPPSASRTPRPPAPPPHAPPASLPPLPEPMSAAPSAPTMFDQPPPAAPRPFTAPPAAPSGLGLDERALQARPPLPPQRPPLPPQPSAPQPLPSQPSSLPPMPSGLPPLQSSQPPPMPERPAVSQYGLPELGSQSFRPPVIRDVTSYTLGIGTVSGYCEAVIVRNTQIPSEASRPFSTSKDGQTSVHIQVFQGDSRRLEHNTLLGELVLGNLPPRPRGETNIAVTFKLNASGMLDVHAVDTATGYQQQATLQIRGMQSQDEVAASQNRLQGLLQ